MKKKFKNKLFWILQLSGWTVLALAMFFVFGKSKPMDYLSKFLFLYSYLLDFLITSFVLRYLLRFFWKKVQSIKWLIIVVFFTVLLIVPVWYFIDVFTSMFFWVDSGIENYFKKFTLKFYFQRSFMVYVIYYAWTTLYFGIKYWMEWQEEKKRSEDAYNLAQKAQLQMLRYQLNPHFLFNSLNSIKALVEEDKLKAKEMITELSDFLRYSLMSKDAAFRPLKDEIDALKLYLSIEKKRFEEKLEIKYDIEEEAKSKMVLSFLLHPLIENAIKYGMKSSKLPLELTIKSYLETNFLVVEICNSGKWIEWGEAEGQHGTGTGLENVKKRLENAYVENYKFDIIKNENKVCIKIMMNTDR